jgi:outer membrane protein OmpA-like peptidoglycan-associated protein
MKQGVEAERLVAKGYGEDRPLADNETEEGRTQNRRVEFIVVKRDGEEVAAAGGAEQ